VCAQWLWLLYPKIMRPITITTNGRWNWGARATRSVPLNTNPANIIPASRRPILSPWLTEIKMFDWMIRFKVVYVICWTPTENTAKEDNNHVGDRVDRIQDTKFFFWNVQMLQSQKIDVICILSVVFHSVKHTSLSNSPRGWISSKLK
jgi:hypothetical protein